jgi:transposase
MWHDHQKLRAEHDKLQAEVERLRLKLAKRDKNARGNVSERRKGKKAGAGTSGAAEPQTPNPPGHGPREQRHLEEREQLLELDAADQICTSCGGQLREWEGEFEESTVIDVEPVVYVRKRVKRKKYRCSCGACIETAPPLEKLMPKGTYTLPFGIEVVHDKYLLHLPLERQARAMQRAGLEIESQTLWDQVNALAFLYEPAYEAIWKSILKSPWLGADDTGWPMMGEGGKANGKQAWNAWLMHADKAVVFMMDDGRTYEQARVMLDGYQGVVVCDGHNSFETLAKKHPGITLGQCWSHARRKFLECEVGYPEQAGEVIKLIAQMYALEKDVPPGPEHDAERKEMRHTKSREVLDRICAWVYKTALTVPKESALRKAIAYMVKRWVGLTRFVDNPLLPLDNNASEREARAPAIGRKNHYGSQTRRGAEVAATMYTLCGTAIRCGVEPKTYLHFTALRSLRDWPVVLPQDLTVEMLVDELGLTRERAERALAYQRTDESDATAG